MTQPATINIAYEPRPDRIGAIATYADSVRGHRVRKAAQVNAKENAFGATETVLAVITFAAILAAVSVIRIGVFLPEELDLLLTRVAMALR